MAMTEENKSKVRGEGVTFDETGVGAKQSTDKTRGVGTEQPSLLEA